jgi:hypothetical protein
MLKTATVKDFISLRVIPILKFGAKIRGQGVKTSKSERPE